jgi:nucleoside-specific outer membrane channel protein Tsx
MWEWITENKVFSGIGGTILTLGAGYIAYLFKNRVKDKNDSTQSIYSGANSTNIQGGNDVNVTIGDKDVQK